MKFDLDTTTFGEMFDDPQAYAVMKAYVPNLDELQLDDSTRRYTLASVSIQIKQMLGPDVYDQVIEKLSAL